MVDTEKKCAVKSLLPTSVSELFSHVSFISSLFSVFAFFSFLSCDGSPENTAKNLAIKVLRLHAEKYEKSEVIIRDENGFVLSTGEFKKGGEISFEIPDSVKIRVILKEKNEKGDTIAEGSTPVFSPAEVEKVNVLVLPLYQTSKFGFFLNEWAEAVEFKNSFFIFKESGDILELDYLLWEIKKAGEFTPRRYFTLTQMEDKIIIAGGESEDGTKTKLVEFFFPETGTTAEGGELKSARSGHKTVLWGNRIVFVGGDKDGTCEVSSIKGDTFLTEKIFRCFEEGEVKDFSVISVGEEDDFIRILLSGGQTQTGIRGNTMLYVSVNPAGEINYFSEEIYSPIRRAQHQAVRVGRNIFLLGGWDGEKEVGECEVLKYKYTKFITSGKMIYPRINFSVIPFDGRFIIAGGEKSNGQPVEEVEIMEGGCVFREVPLKLNFLPKIGNCGFSLFSNYGFFTCEGTPTEIFPIPENF